MLKNISKKNIVIIIVVVVILVLVGVAFYFNEQNKGYSVVYLSTGEVYIGKLCTFPYLRLTNSYVLASTKDVTDSTKNNFQLNPINEALWAPKYLNISRKQIVFYGPIEDSSEIAKTLAGIK